MVFAEFKEIIILSKNRVRLVFQGVAGLAKCVMDELLSAPKAGALPTALYPDRPKYYNGKSCALQVFRVY